MRTGLRRFGLVVTLSFITTAVVGVVFFPYAPIRQVGGEFIDKSGQSRTAEEYHRFVLWERTLFVTGTAFIPFAIGGAFQRYRRTNSSQVDLPPKESPS
jgi:hypothetical protein